MAEDLPIPRRIVRAIHAGVAGVFFVLIPSAIAGNEDLPAALFQRNWNELRYLGYWMVLCLIFLGVALLARRAGSCLLCIFLLLDLPMINYFWDSIKGALLVPVMGVSVICILIEISQQFVVRKRLAT
ncbi:MAG TPA: hypothetical protein VNI81_03725 [Candidatus Limnocylindrales bacterium]|nr:hypothetical protein [Candidatus Limnocylindrales bacterium]